MTFWGEHPPIDLADDPTDYVWRWFVFGGPHGAKFHWQREHAGMRRSVDHLRDRIDEQSSQDQGFRAKLRLVALRALEIENGVMVRTGIQVLAVVGEDEDLVVIQDLLDNVDEAVVRDAKACLFERRIR